MNDNGTPYPKRPSYFANRVARLLSKSAAAQDIGADGCWLVTVIAMTEDAKGYTGPVTFYNSQLMPIAGFTREHTFIAARDRCATHGWLHYEKGGNRRPGKYWAEIPIELDGMADSSTDESVSSPISSADENVSVPRVQLTESSVNASAIPSVIPSALLPIPIPNKESARARKPRAVFVPPTLEEVQAYAREIGYPLNSDAFVESYSQKEWMVGRNKMKDWKAAVRNWKANGWGLSQTAAVREAPPRRNSVLEAELARDAEIRAARANGDRETLRRHGIDLQEPAA